MICKNCKRLLPQQIQFCNGCGAKVIRNRLTMRNLFEDFAYRYLNYDNKFFQTIKTLFTKPEEVIESYVNGTRKKYVNPISLFAINITLSGLYILIIKKYFSEAMDLSSFAMQETEGQAKLNESIMSSIYDYSSLISSIIIPALALISIIVFYNKKFNYTEHLVVYLYTMSLFSMVSMLTSLIVLNINIEYFMTVSLLLYFLAFVYHCYVFKRLFHLNFKQLLLKILLFIPIFFIGYIGVSLIGAIIYFIFSDISLKDFAPKT